MWRLWRRTIFLGTITIRETRNCTSPSNVYHTPSVAALGIAAHETGHAIQHAKAYAPLKARMAIVPVTMIASRTAAVHRYPAALFFRITGLITLGIYCYLVLAGLPIDYVAGGIRCFAHGRKSFCARWESCSRDRKLAGVNSVLNAAALTYMAAFIAALGQLALVDVAPRSAVIDRTRCER